MTRFSILSKYSCYYFSVLILFIIPSQFLAIFHSSLKKNDQRNYGGSRRDIILIWSIQEWKMHLMESITVLIALKPRIEIITGTQIDATKFKSLDL